MTELTEGLVAGLLVALMVAAFARWRGWSVAIPVLAAGVAIGFLPFGPTAPDDAGELFLLILAPLVFGEALSTSYIDFRKFRQPIFALAVGLVLLSSVAVGAVAAAIVPGLPVAMAFALGAILAPTDAVAVAALARRVAMPRRVVTILEGESLVNDGTGLTLLRVALAAAAAGTVSGGEIALILLQSVVGGLAVGVAGGLALAWLVRRGPDQTVVNAFVLIAPFPVYFLAEAVNGSGILAVVATALIVANTMLTHRRFEGRRSSVSAWRQITFILTASAFFLVGLELPETVLALPGEDLRLLPLLVIAVVGVLLASRIAFVLGYAALSRRSDQRIGWREAVVLAWAGTRGPVSGLAAFSLPLGVGVEAAVDQSRLLQATTFVVIAVTLALSPTLGLVARRVGLKSDDLSDDQRAVAVALATRGLDALDEAVRQAAEQRRPIPHEAEATLRARLAGELERIDGSARSGPDGPDAFGLEIAVIKAQQDELLRLRDAGTPDAVIRPAMHDLDLQMSALRARRTQP
ncbi:MAG: cation:proton antiporter [Candidatus Nanopelagicales bacterium]